MAYRHVLGLWVPAVGEQGIVYWLNSSADLCVVCVCMVYQLTQLQSKKHLPVQLHGRVGTAFSSLPAAKSSQYALHFYPAAGANTHTLLSTQRQLQGGYR